MFNRHHYTKDKFIIHQIINYENLDKALDESHIQILINCDVFIYQPFNKDFTLCEYDISNLKKFLKSNCIILKINYYRFKGFWFESEYKPYNTFNKYAFADVKYSGIHNSFMNFNGNKKETIDKINNIFIDEEKFLTYFSQELDNFKKIDDNSDVKMYDYFINNFKKKHLFHDGFHPNNTLFYEIFRQIVFKLTCYELIFEDFDFVNKCNDIDMTGGSLPILPSIKKILELEIPDVICVFNPPDYADQKLYLNVYDYYYIRLSHTNFQNYLNALGLP
jgi:hypothetical protein